MKVEEFHVRLKREYLDETIRTNSTSRKGITGEEWYVQQAARAVNQAIGRVIRHRNDYGAIILCDERFAQGNSQGQMSLWLRPHVKCYSKFGDAAFSLTRFFKDKAAVAPLKSLKDMALPGATTQAVQNTLDVRSSGMNTFKDAEPGPVQTNPRNEISLEIISRKKNVTMGSLSGSGRLGIAGPSATSSSLSDMLAASRTRTNQTLSSLSIVSANCAVGSATGFIRENSKVESASVIRAVEIDKLRPTASDKVTSLSCQIATSAVNSKRRLAEQSFEKPWSLSKHLKGDDKELTGDKEKRDEESGGNLSKVKDRSREELVDTTTKVEVTAHLPCPGISPIPSLPCSKQVLSGHKEQQVVRPIDGSKGEKTVTKPGSDGKTTNAAAFLKEVKAHLSVVEYNRFLECMRGLKNQLMSMATLLEAVANLFCAPERLYLLRRFGDFIPVQHRQLYEDFLAAKCAELGYQSVDFVGGKGGSSAQASEEGSLKSCFTAGSRKPLTKKNQCD